jgi:general nucleoside transport system permease protein
MRFVLEAAFWLQVVRIAVPYALAALGGALAERSGVVDLALEGKLLVGALAAAVGADATGSVYGGAAAGALAGVAVALGYGVLVLALRADQIITGIALNLLAFGLTRCLLKLYCDSTASSPPTPGFDGSPLGNPLLWLVALLVLAAHVGVNHTRAGLRLRAVGEHPEAARSLGVSVEGTRLAALAAAGALAGLGGAWLALDNHQFVAEMSGGRGYIALAAVIMGRWRPAAAVLACLFFALAEAIELHLATAHRGLPSELTRALPFVLTILALAGFIGRSRAPRALGKVD